MPRKNIKPDLKFEDLEKAKYINDPRDLIYYMRGYFESFIINYKNMSTNEIKTKIEDLKVCFNFLDREF